jgi:histidyl-tRNA synthetase
MSKSTKPSKSIQPPKGTRDLYPDDVLKRRYIQNAWRDASLRCGFDEIEGPTFESSDLYSIKSGEGILSELFQTFSGKGGQETLDKLVAKGKADFALRPEFTPTLARMYAARAKQLPKPCKWFTAGPYFRAERPQRGRLREFLQWNCDIIGLPGEGPEALAQTNYEIWAVNSNLIADLGLAGSCDLRYNDREAIVEVLRLLLINSKSAPKSELGDDRIIQILNILDKRAKMKLNEVESKLAELGISLRRLDDATDRLSELFETQGDSSVARNRQGYALFDGSDVIRENGPLNLTLAQARVTGLTDEQTLVFDPSIVRGLAYYTGMVFELIADGERAVAGGGRYDNLIELMGGPPTPAVGFAMGDVVLTNLLEDNNLIPQGQELMEAVARQQASIRPQAFIAVPNNDEENRAAAQSLTATLRRGQESETYINNPDRKPWDADRYEIPPLHTRISYKSTTNPGKLRKDADSQHAKYFIEIHAPNKVELTDMDKRESITSPTHGSFSVNPTDENYIGTALKNLT